ncbi:MAG TPA: hypothetical protein VFJ58_13930 [Armatimonadota bacterium]|nr:hypothetical protein [Armatimonadota bacterium]
MLHSQVLEGTFDEVSAQLSDRAEELRSSGKLRLIIVQGDSPQIDYDAVLAELFDAADNLVAEPGKPLSDPDEARVSELIREKFLKQGLDL